MDGWIKLHRRMTEWEWYHDKNTFKLFIHCLLLANSSDKKWRGIDICRGQFVSSLDNLANGCGLSVGEVRTALKHLELTNELTKSSQAKYSVFTIVSYNKYQDGNKVNNNNLTSNSTNKSQTNNKQLATTKNNKNNKNKENISNRGFTPPTLENVIEYCQERGNKVDPNRFIDFYSSKGWMVGKNKMKDWKAAVRNWERSDKVSPKPNQFTSFSQTKMDAELDQLDKMLLDEINGGNEEK
jgi:hypothetical protein